MCSVADNDVVAKKKIRTRDGNQHIFFWPIRSSLKSNVGR